MNDYLSTIYDTPHEIDPQLAAAGELLAKVAEEEGVDLDDYSDGEINEMLSGMVGQEEQEDEGIEQEGAPVEEKTSGFLPNHITTADVAAELAKVASNEGVDLADLSREQYHDAYNYVHATLTDPAVYQQKVAMEEKVAEADMLGRVMAHSFDDELRKVASGDATSTGAADVGRAGASKAREMGGKMKDVAAKGYGKAKEHAGAAYEFSKKKIRDNPGKAGIAAGLGVGAGLGAVAAARRAKRKSESEKNSSLVLDRAREIAYANGFDPDTGEKVASDLDMAAVNLLRENGYDL
ncbi:MAG: hypothetical protein DRQ64_00070 [Gammaproteobacteria bacterium]|nr:MAG: hypothetical protein DRQ64_00070 [Gammaproteobacteria bacterium]